MELVTTKKLLRRTEGLARNSTTTKFATPTTANSTSEERHNKAGSKTTIASNTKMRGKENAGGHVKSSCGGTAPRKKLLGGGEALGEHMALTPR